MVPKLNAQTPQLEWAKCTGVATGGSDIGQAVATDAFGNVYITGLFLDTVDFDPGPGVFNLTSNGYADVFIQKLDASGNLLWAKNAGGIYYDLGNALAVDAFGNIYVMGEFAGTMEFDAGSGISDLISNGSSDIFILKLDASGNLLWAKSMGGPSEEWSEGVAVDASGNVYATGAFSETADFNPGPAVYPLTSYEGVDMYFVKLNASGNFVWAKSVGGQFDDVSNAIAIDAFDNVYMTGGFVGTVDFDPGTGYFGLTSDNFSPDIFILKLTSTGDFGYALKIGGDNYNTGESLSLDADGNIYLTGFFVGTVDFDPGSGVYDIFASTYDIYVQKLSNTGQLLWVKNMGGPGDDEGVAIALDTSGNVYSTGLFYGTADFDPGPGVLNLTTDGDGRDMYVQKLTASGEFLWANSVGGTGNAYPYALGVDPAGNVFTTGELSGAVDFDPGLGIYELSSSVGESDIFIQKLEASGSFSWAASTGSRVRNVELYSLARDASGNLLMAGRFRGTVDFDPGPDAFYLSSQENEDAFIQKLDASGNFIWAKGIVGTMDKWISTITTDDFGNVLTAGQFFGTADFDPGPGVYNLTSSGEYDIFIQKLDVSGNLLWAKRIGGNSYDLASELKSDASGNVYAAGYFYETVDFDPATGVYELFSNGKDDAFILKLDASGNFLWAKNIGGPGYDGARTVNINADDDIYCTGQFEETVDFDPGSSVFNITSGSSSDIFILKVDNSGNFVWAKSISDHINGYGWIEELQLDKSGNIYFTGVFGGTMDFDPGPGIVNVTSVSEYLWDIFIQKLDASGNLAWVKSIGAKNGFQWSRSISLDAAGNVYTTGMFSDTVDFDPGPGVYNQVSSIVHDDVFIQKLDAAGNFVWARSIGSDGEDEGMAIDVDTAGNIYFAGQFGGIADFDPGQDIFDLSCAQSNIFIAKWSQPTSGVSQKGFETRIKAYPNPTMGNIVIDVGGDYDDLQIEMTTVTGQVISGRHYATARLLEAEIKGPAGLYFVSITDGSGRRVVLKVVKE